MEKEQFNPFCSCGKEVDYNARKRGWKKCTECECKNENENATIHIQKCRKCLKEHEYIENDGIREYKTHVIIEKKKYIGRGYEFVYVTEFRCGQCEDEKLGGSGIPLFIQI